MGNDGGSIPTRRELVKNAARLPTVSELKATALEAQTHAWQNDPVSSDPIDLDNAVSDWRGRLYNYETVLQGLMPGASNGEPHEEKKEKEANDELSLSDTGRDLTFADTGIKSIRDIVRLKGKPYKSASSSETRWQCPVTFKELGPGSKAVYVVPCGHVFSELAVETILPDKLCPECSTSFEPTNIIPILPTDKAELAKLRLRMEALRAEGLRHSLKKDKSSGDKKSKKNKRKAGADEVDGDGKKKNGEHGSADGSADGLVPPPKKKKEKTNGLDSNGIASRINNPMTASLTAKVLAEQEKLQRQRKLAESR
ncbi:Replication termination factor 2 [Sporothrix eucalyptigena]|uniref:Replication termination factor 2 n=1 Tax=Sporothrix eucalyptigena TaxID=1812306 RepID=A0ABP0CLJ2_9PEZI